MASDVMDAGDGQYMISARASRVRGGEAGARQVAYKDANTFCAGKGGHAVVVGFGDAPGGNAAGGPSAKASIDISDMSGAGHADLRFRCAP